MKKELCEQTNKVLHAIIKMMLYEFHQYSWVENRPENTQIFWKNFQLHFDPSVYNNETSIKTTCISYSLANTRLVSFQSIF